MQQAVSRSGIPGSARLVRTLILGAALLLVTVIAHTAAIDSRVEGGWPPIIGLLLLAPLAIALSHPATHRRRHWSWLLAYALAVQALFHVILMAIGSHAAHGSWLPSTHMITGHVLAALVLAAVLTFGDALLIRWGRYLAQALGTIGHVSPAHWQIVPIRRDHTPHHLGHLPAQSIPRRGPPAPCCA